MNALHEYLLSNFYTPVLPCLLALVALGLDLRGRHAGMRYFRFYFIAYLLCFVVICFLISQTGKRAYAPLLRSTPLIDLSETLVEFLVFFRFVQFSLRGRHRRLLQLIRLAFLAFTFVLLLADVLPRHRLYQHTLHIIFLLQAISLLVPCLLYYVSIFRFTPVSSLRDEPSFWVITGLSFMLICTFPLSLFLGSFNVNGQLLYNTAYAIFYVFYALFFLMIIRAYLCNPTSSKS